MASSFFVMVSVMWDIVVWADEKAIDFVPSIWANSDNTQYKYPTSLSEKKVREIIYDCKDLVQNFVWCDVELKKKCVKSLQMAKRYCEDGQYTSNIETEDEDNLQVRRKPRRLIEECGDEENKKSKSQTPFRMVYAEQDDSDDDVSIIRKEFPVPNKKVVVSNRNKEDDNGVSSQLPHTFSSTSSNNMQIELLRTIIKNQADLKFELKELHRKIDIIENRHLAVHTAPTTNHSSVFIDILPIKTVEEIHEVEKLIESDGLFKELVHILYMAGGETVSRAVNIAMKKMLHNDVAILYSGIGKKHKLPFCSLKLYKAINAAIRKRCPTCTDDEIRKNVSLYLAQTKSRQRMKDKVPDPLPPEEV